MQDKCSYVQCNVFDRRKYKGGEQGITIALRLGARGGNSGVPVVAVEVMADRWIKLVGKPKV